MKRIPMVLVFVLGSMLGAGLASAENQPHMQDALGALQSAKTALEQAAHDKGGHREKALEHVNHAIEQVQKGINFDDTHSPRH
jgi:hypothetical protein